jgi:hypothetical protein
VRVVVDRLPFVEVVVGGLVQLVQILDSELVLGLVVVVLELVGLVDEQHNLEEHVEPLEFQLVVVVVEGVVVEVVVDNHLMEESLVELVVEGVVVEVVDCKFQLQFVVELVEWEGVVEQVVVGKYPVVLQALALEVVVVEVLVQLEQVQILDSVLEVEVVAMGQLVLVVVVEVGAFVGDVVGSFHVEGAYLVVVVEVVEEQVLVEELEQQVP